MNETRPIAPTRLPSVDQVLRTPVAAAAIARFGRAATTDAVRRAVAASRERAQRQRNGAARCAGHRRRRGPDPRCRQCPEPAAASST